MTNRRIIVVLVTAALALTLAAAAPGQAKAVSFVDKQVEAGGLLIQNYLNKYGAAHQFVFPPKSMVKKGGGLPDSTVIWPANPWTGRIMGPGTSRGTYTYALGAGNTSYRLTMHLSSGRYVLKAGLPSWLKSERNTASKQNLLLLQRYVETYAAAHAGTYPAAADVTAPTFGDGYVWPKNPWTGTDMVAGTALGDFSYAQLNAGSSYSLKVMLTGGWSASFGPISVLSQLSTAPGG